MRGDCISTNARTAEMAKLTENSFRDVNIAFANELSIICDELKINVWELIALSNRHPRVNILSPGPGVGCNGAGQHRPQMATKLKWAQAQSGPGPNGHGPNEPAPIGPGPSWAHLAWAQ